MYNVISQTEREREREKYWILTSKIFTFNEWFTRKMIIYIGEKIPTGYFKNPAGNSRKFTRIIFSIGVNFFLKKFNS